MLSMCSHYSKSPINIILCDSPDTETTQMLSCFPNGACVWSGGGCEAEGTEMLSNLPKITEHKTRRSSRSEIPSGKSISRDQALN